VLGFYPQAEVRPNIGALAESPLPAVEYNPAIRGTFWSSAAILFSRMVRSMKSASITTITPSLANPGTRCLLISAESREAFAAVILDHMRQWERITISEPTQRRRGGWWHGTGRVWNETTSASQDRVRGEVTIM
jgi:hypothetical protein